MKRVLSLILCMVSLLVLAVPAFAAERTEGNVVYRDEFTLEDGFTVVREIVDVSFARSAEKTYIQSWRISDGSSGVIADIAITATYHCDGRSVYVVSKTVSRADTYYGWSFTQNYLVAGGGTVTLNGKLTKGTRTIPLNLTMTCDKNGNLLRS